MSKKKKANYCRLIGRILSIIVLLFLGVFFAGHLLNGDEGGPPPTFEDAIVMMFFPVGAMIGNILLFKCEKIGIILTLICVAVFYIWVNISRGWAGGSVPAVVALPAVLIYIAEKLEQS